MATSNTTWMCEICHTVHSTQESAEECEKNHAKLNIEMIKPHYAPRDTTPRQITVQFNNGECWKYARQCKIPKDWLPLKEDL